MKQRLKKAFVASVVAGIALGVTLSFHGSAEAGRNSAGNYSAPSADFVTGTVISAPVMNTKLSDLGTEITDSLSRSGKGGMLARLRGVDGTSALPAYAFTAETTLGLYRAASDDLRCSSNGTDIQKWGATGITAYQAWAAQKGATITNSTSNGAGTTSTGNGTGAGVVGTGGATGNGGTFTGGATSGAGVVGTGTGGGNGGTFAGEGGGEGIQATGGALGDGVRAVGGGTNTSGIFATGGAGGVGGYFEAGTSATATDPTNAVTLANGNLLMMGTAPASTEAFTNTLTPSNIPKAWGNISTVGGTSNTVNINTGFNIASGTAAGGTDLVITLAASVGTNAAVHVMTTNVITGLIFSGTASGTTLTIRALDASGAIASPLSLYNFKNGAGLTLQFVIYGVQ